MAIKARYLGKDGGFIVGVPARHLDDEEYDALTTEQKHEVRRTGLYDVKSEADAKPAEKPPAKAEATKGGEA